MSEFAEKRKTDKEKAEKKQFWKRVVTVLGTLATVAITVVARYQSSKRSQR